MRTNWSTHRWSDWLISRFLIPGSSWFIKFGLITIMRTQNHRKCLCFCENTLFLRFLVNLSKLLSPLDLPLLYSFCYLYREPWIIPYKHKIDFLLIFQAAFILIPQASTFLLAATVFFSSLLQLFFFSFLPLFFQIHFLSPWMSFSVTLNSYWIYLHSISIKHYCLLAYLRKVYWEENSEHGEKKL